MEVVQIHPALWAGDLCRLGEEAVALADAGASALHIDIMDGRFAPSLTFGPATVAALRSHAEIPLEVHLLVESPEDYLDDFLAVGADRILFHIEATRHPYRVLDRLREAGCHAGIALNPGTSEDELEFLAEGVDSVLVLGVSPGDLAATFNTNMRRKIENVRALLGDRAVAVEGGLDLASAAEAVRAGANIVIPDTALFDHDSYLDAIERFKHADADRV